MRYDVQLWRKRLGGGVVGTVVWCVLIYVMMSVCGQASEWSHVGTDEYVRSALHMC